MLISLLKFAKVHAHLKYFRVDWCFFGIYACDHFVHVQPFGADDSDVGSPRDKNASAESSNVPVDPPQIRIQNAQSKQKKGQENSVSETEVSIPAGESYRSMGEILSSMDPARPLSVPGVESSAEKSVGKVASSNPSAKRSAFWGRGNVSF